MQILQLLKARLHRLQRGRSRLPRPFKGFEQANSRIQLDTAFVLVEEYVSRQEYEKLYGIG